MIVLSNYYDQLQKFYLLNKIFEKCAFIMLRTVRALYSRKSNRSNKILIISYHKLGDTVFTFPAIDILQRNLKKEITILCRPESTKIYKIYFKSVKYLEAHPQDFYGVKSIAKNNLRKRISVLCPDVIVDITGGICSASLIFNSNAQLIIGLNSNLLNGLYNKFVTPSFKEHLSDLYINVVDLLVPNSNIYSYSRRDFRIKNISKILIHPLAGWKAKEWGIKKYFKLAEMLADRYNVSIILPSYGAQEDILNQFKLKNITINLTNSIDDLITEIKDCSLFIGNDSGPAHIASIFGIPTFIIFGPTNPLYHMPLYNVNDHVSIKLKCSPDNSEKMCFTNGGRDNCPSFECMHQLSVDEVMDNLLLFIDKLDKIIKTYKITV